MSINPRTVILIRRDLTGAGGAERVFKKYQAALTEKSAEKGEGVEKNNECHLIPVNEASGTRGPGWWRTPAAARWRCTRSRAGSPKPARWWRIR